MTIEQLRNHIQSDINYWSKKIQLNGTKKCWNEMNKMCSQKIQTLQDILIFIDTNSNKNIVEESYEQLLERSWRKD